MTVLKVQWLWALSLVCEVALPSFDLVLQTREGPSARLLKIKNKVKNADATYPGLPLAQEQQNNTSNVKKKPLLQSFNDINVFRQR
jgi:hypothetical protein